MTKVPDCSTRDATAWRTLDEVLALGPIDEKQGVGFVFTGGVDVDTYGFGARHYALDIDGCRDPVTGAIEHWAQEIIQQYSNSLTEITPSGCGLRVWILVRDYPETLARAKVKVPYPAAPNVPTHKAVEIQIFGYGVPQYVTVTGKLLPGTESITTVENIDWLVERFDFELSDTPITEQLPKGHGTAPTAATITAKLKHSGAAKLVFDADWTDASLGEDPSASGAYWRVAQEVMRAADGHGQAALDFLLTNTAWGAGDVEESADPAKYTRASWVAAELIRIGNKGGNETASAHDVFDDYDCDSFVPPDVPPIPTAEEAAAASPILSVSPPATPWFDTPPPPREYLLEHPNGDGLLPRGKVGLFSAAGGTGKTTALVQLAASVALRRRWFGHFNIGDKAGRKVLLLLGEEDENEAKRKLYYTCKEMGLSHAEQREVEHLVVPLALAGHALPLLRSGGHGNLEGTEHSDAVLRKLDGGDDWGLVVVDPVSRFTAVNVEADNIVATRYVQEIERFTEAPGQPTCLIVGHTSKADRQAGEANQRGVTGLFDAVRWAATLNATSEYRVDYQTKKNNLGPPSGKVHLLRGNHGLLTAEGAEAAAERTQNEEREKEQAETARYDAKAAAKNTRLEMLATRIFEQAIATPGATANELVALVGGNRADLLDAVRRCVSRGTLLVEQVGRRIGHFANPLLK